MKSNITEGLTDITITMITVENKITGIGITQLEIINIHREVEGKIVKVE